MKLDFAEAVWNRFKTGSVNLRVIPSIKEQCAFVRDIADRCDKVEGEADVVDDDSDPYGIVSADEVAASGVCNKLKQIPRICEDGGEAVPTFVVEVIKPSHEIVETKHDNAKLTNRIVDNERELEDV